MNVRREDPGSGRRRLEITCRLRGQVIWHKAGPSNIVMGLYQKFLDSPEGHNYVIHLPCRAKVKAVKEG